MSGGKIKNGKLIYHLTDFTNLESILEKGLMPRSKLNGNFVDIADSEIISKRKWLDEYVLFHFFINNPFDGIVKIAHPDRDFIYIALKRDLVKDKFKIIPNHPLNNTSKIQILDWDAGIQAIDWELMETRDYKNHQCKELCMSEAVYKGTVIVTDFFAIYVENERTKQKVEELKEKYKLKFYVNVLEYQR
jgi:hypothetical protein|nr:MAG TPA: ssDNA thymidine ADP-ribosyltransferase, DarT [Caudoviricetes sp.]